MLGKCVSMQMSVLTLNTIDLFSKQAITFTKIDKQGQWVSDRRIQTSTFLQLKTGATLLPWWGWSKKKADFFLSTMPKCTTANVSTISTFRKMKNSFALFFASKKVYPSITQNSPKKMEWVEYGTPSTWPTFQVIPQSRSLTKSQLPLSMKWCVLKILILANLSAFQEISKNQYFCFKSEKRNQKTDSWYVNRGSAFECHWQNYRIKRNKFETTNGMCFCQENKINYPQNQNCRV